MEAPSIKKNFMYSTVYQILVLIIPLITTPYVSRVLGADNIGIYSYTSSLQTYFSMFAALGVASYGSREIARARDSKTERSRLFYEIEIMVVIATAVCLVLWAVLSALYSTYSLYLFILSLNILAVAFDISWFFSGMEQFKYIVIRNSIVKLLSVALIFLLVKSAGDLWIYVLIMSGATLLGNLTMWMRIRQFICPVSLKHLELKKHFKESFIYFIPTVATTIYTVMDKTLIGLITDNNYENGYYESATKIINIAKALTFTSLNTVMGSRISYLFAQEKIAEIKQKIQQSLDCILLIGNACCFGIIGIAAGFVPWFFGPDYSEVVPLLCIMSPLILVIGVSNTLGSLYYTPVGKRAQSARFLIIGSVCNLCFNLVFIPLLGARGAAFGSLFAEGIITLLYVHFSCGYLTWKQLAKSCWKYLGSALVMLAVVLLIGLTGLSGILLTLVQIAAGGIVYIGLLIVLKDRFTLQAVRMVLSKIMCLQKG